MAKKPQDADDELANLLDSLDTPSSTKPPTSTTAPFKKPSRTQTAEDMDLDAELAALEASATAPRSGTPRISTPVGGRPAPTQNTRLSTEAPRGHTSEDNRAPRKSTESGRSGGNSYAFTPSASTTSLPGAADAQSVQDKQDISDAPQAQVDAGRRMSEMLDTAAPAETAKDMKDGKLPVAAAAGGGWWGSIVATAAAAAKTAEAAVKEIQHNEEFKRRAEQVKGNVGALRGLGGELSSRALPTFTSLLHTLAPPISSHERLQIHLTHDFLHYPSLDPLIHNTFSRVMAQVEGGDLLVINRGSNVNDSARRRERSRSDAPGWQDGPWWRDMGAQRDLGIIRGLPEGTKLVRVSAEAFAKEYLDAHGGLEAAAKRATEELSESNPVRSSDIFLAVQAISHSERQDLFGAGGNLEAAEGEGEDKKDGDVGELVCFAIYLHDPIHSITFSTLSQSIPAKWIAWLDAASPSSVESETRVGEDGRYHADLPTEIAEIVEGGGVDPREWVAEWVEESIGLAVGIVAQRYVARRMGVGEGRGDLHTKRANENVMADGGGEAARAGL